MKLHRFEEEVLIYRDHVETTLVILLVKDEDFIVAYNPTFRLSGYGSNIDDATQSFEICLEEFLHSFTDNRELEEYLQVGGWSSDEQLPKVNSMYQGIMSDLMPNLLGSKSQMFSVKFA